MTRLWIAFAFALAECAPPTSEPPLARVNASAVQPGITVLLSDSLSLLHGKRIGLITNQTGIDEHGVSDIDLLRSDRVRAANVTLVRLFSPEHGIRGTEDREQIASGIDARSGLPVVSLYGATTVPPPDSTLADLDALVFDVQDLGTRTWTYEGAMVYAMRAAARHHIAFIVLDRPNPISGLVTDGPLLDTALANAADDDPAGRRARPYAVWPIPLRHGLTMGELAAFYNDQLSLHAALHVIPMRDWRRGMFFDETELPWVKPSPNMPDLTSALLYPALVPFEGSNVSVGRGTDAAFQQFGAPWMRAGSVAELLASRELPGVRFSAEEFTPVHPGDDKYGGRAIQGVRITVTDRARVPAARLAATILWALHQTSPDSLRLNADAFDLRMGAMRVRTAIMSGADPDDVMDKELPATVAFARLAKQYWLYR